MEQQIRVAQNPKLLPNLVPDVPIAGMEFSRCGVIV
jgi:hypothetical protein